MTGLAQPLLPPAGSTQTFREYLRSVLVERCDRNPQYSLRAFARSLMIDPSTLAKLLGGSRPLGRRLIHKLSMRLGLNPAEVQTFVEHYEFSRSTSRRTSAASVQPKAPPNLYENLPLDSFKVISDWYHYGILELMQVENFKQDLAWISKCMGISIHQAKSAIERLHRVGILETSPEGRWVEPLAPKTTTTGNAFTHAAFRNLQKSILEKALIALEEVPFEERDQTSMTIAIDSSRLPEAREKIKAFRRELDDFLSGGKRDRVYHLGISLYPISNNRSLAQEN